MGKDINLRDDVRSKLMAGVNELAEAVKVTLGPSGRNVIIGRRFGPPHITKDGVSVAKEIELDDPVMALGANIVKEVADNAGQVGDGTTTATILTQAILAEGMKYIDKGVNIINVKRGMDLAVNKVVSALKEIAIEVDKEGRQLLDVATISANSDVEIGKLIANAFKEVGKDGVVTVEQGTGLETGMKVVEGVEINRGYLSPYFITDTDRMHCKLENPLVFITDRKLHDDEDLMRLMEKVAIQRKSLLIVADDLESDVLNFLVMNKLKGNMKVAAIKAPSFGDNRRDELEDLAIITGATLLSSNIDKYVADVELEELGTAETIEISKDTTTIINPAGKQENINARITSLKSQKSQATIGYDKEKYDQRIARLSGSVAMLTIGGTTEVEIAEKRDRVDDAVGATRAALEEGIVPGGGTAYIRCLNILHDLIKKHKSDVEMVKGIEIIAKAITIPVMTIANNAGVSGEVILEHVKEEKGNVGYDARKAKMVDMIKEGIIDPVKVTRVALENAASNAGLLLTTEVSITYKADDKPELPQMPMR